MAQKFHYSETLLIRRFKSETGINFSEYLTHFRLQKATAMMRETDRSISQIAEACGFSEYRYFRGVFQKKIGCSPTHRMCGLCETTGMVCRIVPDLCMIFAFRIFQWLYNKVIPPQKTKKEQENMKRIKRILTLLLALATVLSLAACGTQKDEPAAGDDGAAAEEKKLVIYSAATDAQVNAVVPLFEERYGIEVEVITGGTGELLARIDAEGDAPYCDVIFGGGESSYSEYKHVFQDYVSPEDANLIESCRNTLGYCTNYNLDSAILMYNTDLIGDIQIKGYKDLLNPELKGKIASADPTASSSAMMHIETILTDFGGLTLENEEGWNFVSDLIKNLDGKLASGSSAAWKSVADGEMTVVLTYEEAGISLARSGANVAIVYPEEGTVLTPGTVGLIKNCSHPENGKLFIDFVLSQEVQNILCNDLDLRPVRDDVSYPDYFRPASDIKTVALDQQYVNEHKAEIVDKFTEVYQGTF